MLLKIGYIALSVLMVVVLLFVDSRARKISATKSPANLLFVLIGWNIYIFAISMTGLINNLEFPPRFVLATIIPAFIFNGWFAYRASGGKWLSCIPAHWLIFYQVLRIGIETLFIISVADGILHPNVTLEGYNYDMIYAFTAIPVGWLVFKGKLRFGLWWNYLGLVVIASIIFLFQTTIYMPHLYGPETATFPVEFLAYPYILVAAFLMPSAVLVHLLSIVQLHGRIKEK
jgi:hypothetical protein